MKQTTIALLLLLLAGCASSPNMDSSSVSGSMKTTSGSGVAVDSEGSQKSASISSNSGRLAAEALEGQSVYFDFDKYSINPAYYDIVVLHAGFIKVRKNDIVTLEGNADEWGSNEYNLALGDRRADAVRRNLEMLGVPPSQIRTVSRGEEKPRLSCHEEKCWKENRRCDFIHKLD